MNPSFGCWVLGGLSACLNSSEFGHTCKYLNRLHLLNQAVDASFSLAFRFSGGSSIDEDGIFFVFLIHSAARCSASSSCSMVIDSLTWFLARVICSLAIRNHM